MLLVGSPCTPILLPSADEAERVSAGHAFMKALSDDALEKDEVEDDSGFVPCIMRWEHEV